jgi:hypothetical protein
MPFSLTRFQSRDHRREFHGYVWTFQLHGPNGQLLDPPLVVIKANTTPQAQERAQEVIPSGATLKPLAPDFEDRIFGFYVPKDLRPEIPRKGLTLPFDGLTPLDRKPYAKLFSEFEFRYYFAKSLKEVRQYTYALAVAQKLRDDLPPNHPLMEPVLLLIRQIESLMRGDAVNPNSHPW